LRTRRRGVILGFCRGRKRWLGLCRAKSIAESAIGHIGEQGMAFHTDESKRAEGQPGFLAQLQAILNVLPAYSWYSAPSGGLTFVNKRTAEYLGIPEDHPMRFGIEYGAQWDDWVPLLHPDDQEEARNYRLASLRTGKAGEHSYRVRSAQGNYRWFLTRFEPLRASDGTLLLWIGATLDIEDLKRTEHALRESEYKLRQITETVPGFLWSAAPDGDLTHVNRRILDYSGARLEDFTRRGWQTFLHPDDLPETAKAFDHAIQTGISYQAFFRLRRADGEYRWYHTRGEPLHDQPGRIVQWYGLSIDIDEAKKAEDLLQRSEAYLTEAQRLSHTGTWVLNPTTMQYRYWSEEAYRIWGFDPSQGLPSHEALWQRIHDRDSVWKEVQKALGQKKDYSGEFKIVLPNGVVKYLAATSHHLFSSNGELVEVIGTNVDVTERKLAEQGLRESEYKLRQIIDTVPSFLWSTGADGEPTHVSQRVLEYSGMRLEEFKNRGWEAFLHPADFPETAAAFYHAIQTGTPYQAVHRLRRAADGEYRWHHARGEPLRDREGRIVQWYGLSIDIDEGKKADDLLRRSEALLTAAQRLSQCGVSAFNRSQILYWSEETYRIWGFDPAQGLPSREAVFQRIHPADQDRVRAEAERSFDVKIGLIGYRIILPDGTVKHLESISQPMFSASGELIEVIASHADVTERKRAEDLLRSSEAHLAEAQRLSHTGAVRYNGAAILFASEETYRIWGFDPARGLPNREAVFQRIHPDDRDWLNAEVRRAVDEKRKFSIGYRIVMPDGTVKHLETIGQPAFSANGKLVEIFAIQTDVTERKRAEQGLRESEAKFRDYAETASDWFWEIGPDYKFTLLTENAFGSHGVDRIGTACWDHALDLETDPEKWRLIQATLDSHKPFRDFVYCSAGPNGTPMYVRASGKPVFDADGEFRGYRGTGSDVTAITRAQEALRESERSLRSAIDGVFGHVAIMAPNGELDGLNRQAIEYFGRSLEEMKNWAASDAVHPEDLPRIAEFVKRSITAGIPFHYETRLRRFNGEYRWFDNRAVPIRDDSERIVRWYILGTDIEDRKRAEQALRESEKSLQTIIDTIPAYVSRFRADGTPDFLNQTFRKFTGVDEVAEVAPSWRYPIGDTLRSSLHPEDFPDHLRDWFTHVPTGEPYVGEIRVRRADGVYRWLSVRRVPLRDANGVVVNWYGVGFDVDDQKRTEAALRDSEQRFRSAIDGIAGLVAIMAPNGEVETVNRQCVEYFGRSLEELGNWQISDAVHPDDLARILELFKRALASESPFNYELRLRRFDGEYRWFDNRGVPIRDDSGRITRWYVLLTDIEDRTQALARLEQMRADFAHINRVSMMGELAASLSHEITQPIASARNNARAAQNFLDKQPPDLGEVREALGCVVGDTDRAGDMIERIRDQIKRAPPRKRQFDLNEAITEVIALARSAIIKNGVSVQTRLPEGLYPIQGDRVQLQQVALNLVLNAVEAMGSSEAATRELLISTELDHTNVLVAVRDSGPGIDPSHLEHVFDAFYTTKSSGMGMGLSICRSIIEAHGGRLWAEANEPRGAVFQFTLPAEMGR
jgi:PAS domain S-box-containing protein